MPVDVRYYTDPACSWSWGSEPKLRRLMWEFGDQLRFTWVMGGLARSYGPDDYPEQTMQWLEATAESGMPTDPRLWSRNPIASTYPLCQAAKAAAEQGPDATYRYLRRLREGLMTELKKLDHAEALIWEAGMAGLDPERFRIDLSSNAITEAFAADLEEARNPPEGHERPALPSALFRGQDGSVRGVWGWSPYEAYRDAASACGARLERPSPPGVVAAIERFGRCATKELEELTGRPNPVLQAELWGLAREWRLRAAPVLGGTFWELAG